MPENLQKSYKGRQGNNSDELFHTLFVLPAKGHSSGSGGVAILASSDSKRLVKLELTGGRKPQESNDCGVIGCTFRLEVISLLVQLESHVDGVHLHRGTLNPFDDVNDSTRHPICAVRCARWQGVLGSGDRSVEDSHSGGRSRGQQGGSSVSCRENLTRDGLEGLGEANLSLVNQAKFGLRQPELGALLIHPVQQLAEIINSRDLLLRAGSFDVHACNSVSLVAPASGPSDCTWRTRIYSLSLQLYKRSGAAKGDVEGALADKVDINFPADANIILHIKQDAGILREAMFSDA